MNEWFSAGYPLVYSLFPYLTIKELGKWRQTSTCSYTSGYVGDWFQYVQRCYRVRKCAKCGSIRSWLKTEWCSLCESWVCVDHLERCGNCNRVYCSQCVSYCER